MKTNRLLSLAFLFYLIQFCYAQKRYPQYEQYVEQYKDIAIEQMRIHKIPASITLAQGILESGAGKSLLAVRANNHFGIKCHTDWKGGRFYKDDDSKNECFRVYSSVRDSYEDHSRFLLRPRYARLYTYDIFDYKAWARGLKACGYATSSTYAERLIDIIETYELYLYDRGSTNKRSHRSQNSINERIAYLHHNHQPYLVNDIVCYRGMEGDDWDVLAKELGVSKRKLLKYNECNDTYTQLVGMNIFVAKKKSKAERRYENYWHKVKPGESMYSISQTYGIRLKKLYKLNFKDFDYVPITGDLLKIR